MRDRVADPRVCSECGFPTGACECGTIRDGPEYRDVPTLDEDAIAEQYATEAIESRVLDEDGETIGHVGLFDVDEAALREAVEASERLPAPTALLRSGARGYHLWSLAVDGLDAWLDRAERIDAIDEEHIALSRSRGCMVLRIDAKVALDDGREVRPAPAFNRWVSTGRESPAPVSRPHAEVLDDRFGATLTALDREVVGESTPRRAYLAEIGGRD